jgi:hypothetical protein
MLRLLITDVELGTICRALHNYAVHCTNLHQAAKDKNIPDQARRWYNRSMDANALYARLDHSRATHPHD